MEAAIDRIMQTYDLLVNRRPRPTTRRASR
jgi:hypothetical protein